MEYNIFIFITNIVYISLIKPIMSYNIVAERQEIICTARDKYRSEIDILIIDIST